MTVIPSCSFRWAERTVSVPATSGGEVLYGGGAVVTTIKVLQQRVQPVAGKAFWQDVPTVKEEQE